MSPKRIQRRREKGWRMPADTVYVGRPTRWGNPFVVMRDASVTTQEAVDMFEMRVYEGDGFKFPSIDEIKAELRGKNLACWCPLEDESGNRFPCHADVLLEIANGAGR